MAPNFLKIGTRNKEPGLEKKGKVGYMYNVYKCIVCISPLNGKVSDAKNIFCDKKIFFSVL